jgi:hypothetical protein
VTRGAFRSRGRWNRSVVSVLACLGLGATGAAALELGTDYGAGLSLARVSPLAKVLAAAERHTEEPVLIQGRISEVCQRKGCWTILVDGNASIRVRFKDYAFFLPTESGGRHAYVEGVVRIETLSEKQARHYASESETGSPESIHGPQREIGFVASGVRLLEKR